MMVAHFDEKGKGLTPLSLGKNWLIIIVLNFDEKGKGLTFDFG